ncbi:FAD-binding oxidoreductase [Kordiimonas marina]|uniref:FAD-binding oxidoreductase n=1 Tax=Kordiimonas marina TaxID=2872312 RepID=UPI001FF54A81|nr:FAD-linked oxidase C-terminal domain-containing protein [Kordiimonas marina]MCJ9428496.1 FAD-binding protein [Kordiimonas marina]
MNKDMALKELSERFGDRLSVKAADRDAHGRDEGGHDGPSPDAVFRPENTREVADAVKICARYRLPVIPFGAGTSLEGHITAPYGGLSIDMSGMNRILAVHSEDLDVRVEAGVTRKQLNAFLHDKGLFFPVDPGADATLGGMVSTRASGTNAVRYGTMREQVLSLEVVTPMGEIIETGTRARKSAAGYDLNHLFVGAEGTLGIVTEMTVKVYGIPEKLAAGICRFPSLSAAIETVIDTIQIGLPVARIELLDELSIRAVNKHSSMDNPEQPTLFVEFHGSPGAVEEQIELFRELADDRGGSAIDFAHKQEDINRLWHARHQLYYATRALAAGKNTITTDVCVPISRLGDCMLATRADFTASGLFATMLGHVGDGNFHTIIAADPDNPEEMALADQMNENIVRRAIEMGGTCTGEHGIGTGKRTFLEWERGHALMPMRQIKAAFDPFGIMNPGKVFALTDADDALCSGKH